MILGYLYHKLFFFSFILLLSFGVNVFFTEAAPAPAPRPAFKAGQDSGNFSSSFSKAISGGGSVTKSFSRGNVSVSVPSSYFASIQGGTASYRNGDGTYNTVTVRSGGSSSSGSASRRSDSSSKNDYEPGGTSSDSPIKINDMSLGIDPYVVRYGESVTITWDGGNSEECTLAGRGIESINDNVLAGSQIIDNVEAESIYTLTCSLNGAPDEVKTALLKVLPRIQES